MYKRITGISLLSFFSKTASCDSFDNSNSKKSAYLSSNGVAEVFTDGITREPRLGVDFANNLNVVTQPWNLPTNYSLIGATPRCMHNACWLSIAKAYVLGLYIDSNKIESLRRQHERGMGDLADPVLLFDPEIEKTFVFAFVASKDKAHIANGFDRALSGSLPTQETYDYNLNSATQEIRQFVRMVRDLDIVAGSRLFVSVCSNPKPGHSVIHWIASENEVPQLLGVIPGTGLSIALHALYLERNESGRYKYADMAKDLHKGVEDLIKIMK